MMIACHNCPFFCGQSGLLCAATLMLLGAIMAVCAYFDTTDETTKDEETANDKEAK